ncbi:MAG: hypothetical protein ACYTEZ_05125 [Planctomycetota bacterium]
MPGLLWLVGALAACRAPNPEQGVSREQVAIPPPERSRGEPKQPPQWFEEQIAAAEQAQAQDRVREALERVLQAKTQDPGEEHLARLNELLGELHRAVLELDSLVGWVDGERDPIVFGRTVRVRIHLHNPTPRPIRVPARPPPVTVRPARPVPGESAVVQSSKSLFVLDVVRRDYDTRAQVVSTSRRLHRPLARDLDLPPGGTREIILDLGMAGNDRGLAGFRTFTVGGQLRAAIVEVGGMRRWDAIPLREGTLRSFRPGYEHLASDPVGRIAEAAAKRAYVHLLTATALVPHDRRRDAVDRLVGALGQLISLDWALFSCLQYLTGIELGRDADAWRAWWPRVRATYFAPPARKPRKDVPDFGGD